MIIIIIKQTKNNSVAVEGRKSFLVLCKQLARLKYEYENNAM